MAGKFYKQFGVISSFGPDCKVFFLCGERQNNNLEFADKERFPRNRAQNLKKPFEETLYSLFFLVIKSLNGEILAGNMNR